MSNPQRRTGRVDKADEYVQFDTAAHSYIAQRCGLSTTFNVFISTHNGGCQYKDSFSSMAQAEAYAAMLAGRKTRRTA